jgi:hypothetical protein
VTRAVLCATLAALTLVLGILTAIVQSENHDRGQRLNALKEECSMIEAINGDRSEQILERDFGPIAPEAWAPAKDTKPAPRPAAGLVDGAKDAAHGAELARAANASAAGAKSATPSSKTASIAKATDPNAKTAAPDAKSAPPGAKSAAPGAKTVALAGKGVVR